MKTKKVQCHDQMSGERFTIPADAVPELAIEAYIRAGIDTDVGTVDYDVETDDGRHFSGSVQPVE